MDSLQEDKLIDKVIGLGKTIELFELTATTPEEAAKASKLKEGFEPLKANAQNLLLRRLRNNNLILGCLFVLKNLPKKSRTLAKEITHLLQAPCWNQEQRIEAALAWAQHRIDQDSFTEQQLGEAISIWPTVQAALQYGLILIQRRLDKIPT